MRCWQWSHLISDDLHTVTNLSWDWLKVPLIGSNNKGASNKQQMYSSPHPEELLHKNMYHQKKKTKKQTKTTHQLHCGQDHTGEKKKKGWTVVPVN